MHNIGIIGGSGLYEIEGLSDATELRIDTPWGSPSDTIVRGTLSGRTVYFLPRHGRGHRILPTEINHRANIYAMRSLGVRWIVSVSAVGSLQPQYEPCHIVVPDQFVDNSSRRGESTFFGNGIVGHIAFGEPTSPGLRKLIAQAAEEAGATVHNGGTYVQIDGPAFSTRAESEANRRLGFDIVGMTNAAEAKLAREAEIAFATMSMVTDYDCWHPEEADVTAQSVIENLRQSVATAKAILARLIPKLPTEPAWPEHFALDNALSTDKSVWPPETVEKLGILLHRFVS